MVPNSEKLMDTRGRRPSAFIVSRCFSLSSDVLFSKKIVERANENNKPRDMTANARGKGQKCLTNCKERK